MLAFDLRFFNLLRLRTWVWTLKLAEPSHLNMIVKLASNLIIFKLFESVKSGLLKDVKCWKFVERALSYHDLKLIGSEWVFCQEPPISTPNGHTNCMWNLIECDECCECWSDWANERVLKEVTHIVLRQICWVNLCYEPSLKGLVTELRVETTFTS